MAKIALKRIATGRKFLLDPKEQEKKSINEKGVIVGPAYDFLFEGENEDYDDEFGDYI